MECYQLLVERLILQLIIEGHYGLATLLNSFAKTVVFFALSRKKRPNAKWPLSQIKTFFPNQNMF